MSEYGDDYVRGYSHYNEAWYAVLEDCGGDEIMIGLNHREGGTVGEFAIRWHELGQCLVPRLEAFNDSWKILVGHFADLLAVLPEFHDANITPKAMCQVLDQLGIEDQTPREAPSPPVGLRRCSECGREYDEAGNHR